MYLEINNLSKSYGQKETMVEVLKGISFGIDQGEICVLLGPSGSGKSTLLNIIGGIDSLDRGEIIVGGVNIANDTEKQMLKYRRDNLGYIFQNYNLLPDLNVKENIEIGQYLSKNPLDIDMVIKRLGLWEHRFKSPNQLSGGQQQRVSIARALVKNPKILLCDEPTGALDYHTSKEILSLIEEINREFKTTVILVTHNEVVKNMGDRVIKLHDGQIRANVENTTKVKAMELEW